MPPVPAEVKYTETEGESFPNSYCVYELDGAPFDGNQKRKIYEALGRRIGKFIVYGEKSAEEETQNRVQIIFFPDSDHYSHGSVLEGILRANPEYDLKDAGRANFQQGSECLDGVAFSLEEVIDRKKQEIWRTHMKSTLGVEVWP